MARPQKIIDPETVKKLAALNCSFEEIGHIVGCSVDTLERRFAGVIKEGRSHGKVSLKRKMFDTAIAGNVTMMIWLSKNLLGYTDKVETKMVEVSKEDTKILIKEAQELVEKMQ
jgi:hypothetical protein